jgi:hypothetical protein
MIFSTHDIDWLNPRHPIGVTKWLLQKPWVSLRQLSQKDLFLRQTERLLLLQQSQKIKGIFLIGMQDRGLSYLPKALRYSYSSAMLKDLLFLLKKFDAPLGLHHHHRESIQIQIKRFETIAQVSPKYVRGHYYAQLSNEDAEFLSSIDCKIDFGFGHRTLIGFQKGITPLAGMQQIPTIFSDNNITHYKKNTTVWETFEDVLVEVKTNNNQAAILFHPENFAVYPHLLDDYLKTIRLIKQVGIDIF